MATHNGGSDGTASGFVPFFRSYTKTWIHAVATAGLTAFGTLTIVHRWFAALALASYVVPPIVLYVRKLRRHERQASETADSSDLESGPGNGSERDSRSGHRPGESQNSSEPRAEPDRTVESGTEPRIASDPEPGAEFEPESRAESEPETAPDTRDDPESGPPRDGEASASDAALEESRTGRSLGQTAEDERMGEGRTDEGGEEGDNGSGEDGVNSGGEDGEDETPAGWHRANTPVSATLFDGVVTAADDSYAVGASGVVIADTGRESGTGQESGTGRGWTTVLEDGPAAQGNALRGVDATSEGDAVWIAGDGGAVGRIDAETGRHIDYTAPADRTDNLADIAVAGASGEETVLVSNGSGEILRGRYQDGTIAWDDPIKPGSGSSLAGVAFVEADAGGSAEPVGYCCDTSDGVFETDDGGRSFTRIGLEGADGTLEAVATDGLEDCLVSADDGVVHRYGGAETWTPERVTDEALTGIARRDGHTITCAAGGTIHERAAETAIWERIATDVSGPLHAVSLGPGRAVAVGADGVVLERGRPLE